MAGQQFFNFCELFILCSYSSQFIFFELFTYAVTVSNFSELFSSAAAVFFFTGINSAYVFCGRVLVSRLPLRIPGDALAFFGASHQEGLIQVY